MLDQNTDRMWYVIGAVLIGAAIIFGANTMFPSAFASISSMFTDISDQTSQDVNYNFLQTFDVTEAMLVETSAEPSNTGFIYGGGYIDYNQSDKTFTVTVDDLLYGGVDVRPGQVDGMGFKPNTKYELTYTLERLDASLNRIQHEVGDSQFNLVNSHSYVDGVGSQLQTERLLDPDLNMYSVKLSFITTDSIHPLAGIVVRPNGGISSPTTVRISNLQIKEF